MRIFPEVKLVPSSWTSRTWLYCAIFLLTALAVYSGGWNNDFLINWDDPEYVTDNLDIQSITLDNLHNILTRFYLGTYAPVQMLSYMLDYALWGPTPRLFLLVNVVLHGLNAFLFYRIISSLGLSAKWALFAALLFTVHPVQVESVAWISQRKSVLAMTFSLLSFRQYLSYTQEDERRWRHYALSLGFFLLALLTKSVSVILPAILLSYDLLLGARTKRFSALAVRHLPFVLLAVGGVWLAVVSQGPEYQGGRASSILGGSFFSATITMMTVYKKYLFNLFWPLQLSAEYRVEIKHAIDVEVMVSAVLMAGSLASVILVRPAWRRGAAFCLAVSLIGFLPVSQIVPFVHLMNDRYLYFPMLGFTAGLGVLLHSAVVRFRILGKLVVPGSIIVLLFLAVASWQRTGVWANSLTLWQDAVTKQPATAAAWENLGHAYDKSAEHEKAIASYRQALALNPSSSELHFKMGTALLNAGEFASAIESFCKSLELNRDSDKVLYDLGYAYMLTGQYQAAVETLEQGVRLDPEGLDMLVFLGANYYCLGDLSSASRVYEQIRRGDSQSEFPAMATGMLALIALRQGDLAASRQMWLEAVASGSAESEIYLNWARMEALGHRRDEAIRYLTEALSHGSYDLSGLSADPTFNYLHNDAEFTCLVKK